VTTFTTVPTSASLPLVLLLHAERGARAQYAHHLHQAGFDVIEAENGLQALEAVAVRPPDVLVIDLDIPSIDGLAFCRRLRSEPRARVPLVVLATRTFGGPPLEREADDDMLSRLTKPCPPERLIAEVRYLVGMREERHRHESAGRERTPVSSRRIAAEPVALDRIREEFVDLPCLRLTIEQAQRLWHRGRLEMEVLLASLVADGFLRRATSGHYERAAVLPDSRLASLAAAPGAARMAKADLASVPANRHPADGTHS
jgi:DNA-binding response OmpR family regulator